MNRGTYDGTEYEILFVKDFNKHKTDPKFNLLTMNKDVENLYMVRVTTNQISTLSNKVTKTRADCYLIYSTDNFLKKILIENDYYLSEQNIEGTSYKKIPHSGISVKLNDSKNFQIIKLQPKSFYALFSSYELGAGASLFCLNESELIKNKELIKGWNTTSENMMKTFPFIKNLQDLYTNKIVCQKIKTLCIKQITDMIDNSVKLQQKIFNGYPIYNEPYSAWYLFSGGKISELKYIPFVVTTGSGRSNGDFTIVLKPKN